MTYGMRWRGVKCPSCGCTGTGPAEPVSCDCGSCIPPDSITINNLVVYRASGSNISGNLVANPVSMGTGLVASRDTALELPPCTQITTDVEGCWYGPVSDSSNDLTLWGGKYGSGFNLNPACDLIQPATSYYGNYFYGAEVWARTDIEPLSPNYGATNQRSILMWVFPKQLSIWNGTEGVPTDFANSCERPYLVIRSYMDPTVKDNHDPYVLCSDTSTYKTSYATSHCSPQSADAVIGSTPAQPLCDCWSNDDGGGCQFQGASPISNYSRTSLLFPTVTQNGSSYWDEDDGWQAIKIPVTDGAGSWTEILKRATFADSAGSGRFIKRDGFPDAMYLLDSCSGSVSGANITDPNDAITFTATSGSDC